MAIGQWGPTLTFSVTENTVQTFNNLSRTVTATWAKHSRIGQKDQSEFLKPSLQTLTFDMTLSANLGVRPRTMLEYLEACVETGQVYPMVINGRKIGKNQWAITSTTETWDTVMNQGELVKATVQVTMEEYL